MYLALDILYMSAYSVNGSSAKRISPTERLLRAHQIEDGARKERYDRHASLPRFMKFPPSGRGQARIYFEQVRFGMFCAWRHYEAAGRRITRTTVYRQEVTSMINVSKLKKGMLSTISAQDTGTNYSSNSG